MRNPKPFTVIQNGKPILTIHARSIEATRTIAACKIAGKVVVVAVSLKPALDGAAK